MWLFTKEAAIGIIRTIVPGVYAWLLTQWPTVTEVLPGIPPESLVVAIGAALYVTIRAVAEKLPAVGYLLIFNQKPTY